MTIRIFLLSLALLTSLPYLANAQSSSGIGLNHVQSARVVQPGSIYLKTSSNTFSTSGQTKDGLSTTFWSVSGRVNINYGLNEHFELFATPTLYQDTNRFENATNTPGDFLFGVKFSGISSPVSSLSYGASVIASIPSAGVHNIPFEPYSAGKFAFGVNGLLTYSLDGLYSVDSPSVHVNLGYWNHNDVGAELIKGGPVSTRPTSASQELLYGIGVEVPRGAFSLSAELFGNAFITTPLSTAKVSYFELRASSIIVRTEVSLSTISNFKSCI